MTAVNRNKFSVMAGQVHIEPAPDAEHLIARLGHAGVTRDEDYGAWVLPATPLVASLIRETFAGVGKVQTDVAFRNLLKLADNPTAVALEASRITFKTPLWDHQAEGVKLAQPNPGFVFGYEPGAGKTLTAFRTIAERGHQKILAFAPKRVLSTWVDQAERHTEGLIVRAFGKGDIKRRVKDMQEFLGETEGVPSVSVINYESIDQKGLMRDFLLKQDWDLLVADECVPGDTLINTPEGQCRIDELRVGDHVWGYDTSGNVVPSRVEHTFRRYTETQLVKIGNTLMTPNHRVYTDNGYIPSESIGTLDTVYYIDERITDGTELPALRYGVHSSGKGAGQGVLQRQVQKEGRNHSHARREAQKVTSSQANMPALRQGVHGRQKRSPILFGIMPNEAVVYRPPGVTRVLAPVNERNPAEAGGSGETGSAPKIKLQSVSRSGSEGQGQGGAARAGVCTLDGRQWAGLDCAADVVAATIGLDSGACGSDTGGKELGPSVALQDRPGRTNPENSNRNRWPIPRGNSGEGARRQEGFLSGVEGLAGIALQEQGDSGRDRPCGTGDHGSREVFNIETATGNYFANGLLVSNCHRIKSAGGVRSRWLATLGKRIPYRLGLTGTLLPHGPLDVYGQYRMLDPRVFGTNYAAFKGRYMNMHPLFPDTLLNVKPEMAEEFQRRIHSIAHFVKTEDVLDLPEMLPLQRVEVDLEPSARKVYKELEEDFWAEVEDGRVTADNILVKIIRLQQVTSGWLPLDDGRLKQISQAKEKALADLLSDIDPQEPVVVFCRFHQDLDAIGMVAANISGRKYAEISGRVGEEGYTAWQEGRANIIGIQIQAGGEGLNDLVNSRILIYYNVTYSLGVYTQSQARLQRPGQIRNVAEYHLVASGTIDEKILRALSERRNLVESILTLGRDA